MNTNKNFLDFVKHSLTDFGKLGIISDIGSQSIWIIKRVVCLQKRDTESEQTRAHTC